MALSLTLFNAMTLSIKGLFATFNITTLSHYSECCVLFIVMPNVILLSVVVLNIIMLIVVMLNVIMLIIIMLNVIMLCEVMLSVVAPVKQPRAHFLL